MELSILHAFQLLHNPVLDKVMVTVFNNLVGTLGQLWIVVGLVLLAIPRTRKCGAAAIYHYYKKAGIGVFVFAALVGFSRMYFFVHYPTDVLFGAILGIATAFMVCVLLDKICAP